MITIEEKERRRRMVEYVEVKERIKGVRVEVD